jgi:hypothetical protein
MKFSVNEDIEVTNRLQKRNSHFPVTFLEVFHHKAMSIEQKFRFDRVFRPFDESYCFKYRIFLSQIVVVAI